MKQLSIFTSFITFVIIFCYFFIDKEISHYFIEHAQTYKVIGKTISLYGESKWYIGIGVLGAIYYTFIQKNERYKQRFLFLLYANFFSGFISLLLKISFARLRPWNMENGQDAFGFLFFQNSDFTFLQNLKYQFTTLLHNPTPFTSFPSGHTTTMFALFTYMSILFPKQIYLWFILSFIGAMSRVLANDHFISDVLAGILIGILSTLFVYSKIKEKI